MDQLLELQWGTFTPQHFISLLASALIAFGLHFLLRGQSEKTKTSVLFCLSLIGPLALLHDLYWGLQTTVLVYLPLHMCSYNALLTPVLIKTKNQFLGNLIPLFGVGAALSLIFNSVQAEYTVMSFTFVFHFLSHTLGWCLPILMFSLKLVRPNPKYILPCVGATFGLYTLSHIANLIINPILQASGIVDYLGNPYFANYMFSLSHEGNPALAFFWSLIPHPYFYMFAALPIIALAFSAMNVPHLVRYLRAKRQEKTAK